MKKKLVLLSLLLTLNVPFAAERVGEVEEAKMPPEVTSSTEKVALSEDARVVLDMCDGEDEFRAMLETAEGKEGVNSVVVMALGRRADTDKIIAELVAHFKSK